MSWRLSCIATLLLFFAPSPLHAKPDFKLDGRINLELESEESFSQADLDKEAVLELETRREEGFQGGIDARITSDSGTAELREIYIDHESESGTRLMIGQHRKRFGLDWEYKMEDRIALDRSVLNEKLTALSYVGRDTLIRYTPARAEGASLSHDLSFHTANGLNAAILYGLKHWIAPTAFLGSYTLGQLNRVEKRSELSAAQAFAFSRREETLRVDAELILGEDHLETEFHELAGTPKQIYFSALQAMGALRIGRYEPLGRATLVLNDLSRLGNRTLELTAGSRLYLLDDLYLGLQLQRRETTYVDTAGVSETEGLAVMRYFF